MKLVNRLAGIMLLHLFMASVCSTSECRTLINCDIRFDPTGLRLFTPNSPILG